MKSIGTTVAILLFLAILGGIGYGIFAGYKFISAQWHILNSEWRASLTIIATVLIICSIFISASPGSYIKKHGLTNTGKVMAYNEFINWYSDLKNEVQDKIKPASFKFVKNQIMLWGGNQVVKQTNTLFESLNSEMENRDRILEKAEHVLQEIRRELGYRSFGVDRSIS